MVLPKHGNSFGMAIKGDKPLSKEEVLYIAAFYDRFDESCDINVSEVVPLSKNEYKSFFNT